MAHRCGLACRLYGGAGRILNALLALPALLGLRGMRRRLDWPKLCSSYGCAVSRNVFCCIGRNERNERQYGAEKNLTSISTHGTLLSPPTPF